MARPTKSNPMTVYVKRQPHSPSGAPVYLVWRAGRQISHVCTGGLYSESVTDALISIINKQRHVVIKVIGGAK